MNFHKAKILLEKINRLHASMNDDQDNINPIEKDLMLNYIREYYEVFYWDKEQSAPKVAAKPKKVKAPTPPKPKPEPIPEPVAVKPPPAPPKPVVPPTPPPVMETVKIKKEEVKEELLEVVTSLPKEAPKPKKDPVKFEFTPPKPKKAEKKKEVELDPESEELFETKQATELSEKLGLSPIMDLNKAFGLNDRMLYTNQLFAGDNNIYKETMAVLNSFNSLEQAKVYLIENIAGKYGWTNKGKKKQAKEFIRTISRKYTK